MKDFRKDLLELKDDSYKEFHKKLMPTVDEDTQQEYSESCRKLQGINTEKGVLENS